MERVLFCLIICHYYKSNAFQDSLSVEVQKKQIRRRAAGVRNVDSGKKRQMMREEMAHIRMKNVAVKNPLQLG